MAELFFFIIFINHFFGINHIIVMYQPLLSIRNSAPIGGLYFLQGRGQTNTDFFVVVIVVIIVIIIIINFVIVIIIIIIILTIVIIIFKMK